MQLAYSELQPEMHAESGRRKKAQKIIRVLEHHLGREDLKDLVVLDLGCSTGFIADELAKAGGQVVGIDIDEPGLVAASKRFGNAVAFLCTDGSALPFPDNSVDIVVFNQIYEHVVDPDAVMDEIRRILSPTGVAYLGLGNRLQVIEPHYGLPLLSWLPYGLADRYMRAAGKGEKYYERFRTRPGLRKLCHGLRIWDYTYTVLCEPERFGADDMVPGRLATAPPAFWKALAPIIPTYIWLGTKEGPAPAGGPTRFPPTPFQL
ncbi:ubiquinone biosynthesis methyltransferase UbiE [Actinophytocola xinjiangensis]|uniref:Ubiquinone biosynthesis methyltransferase UbiE n=2 Tax=Actinophytocola xinjiangensis TaxID=485602 RepID=A0A7Z1B0C8_9PSEU|nr:ubiquinone biosynthesis methyltransferase UbiE [Actinophytocola xinjiangensis]